MQVPEKFEIADHDVGKRQLFVTDQVLAERERLRLATVPRIIYDIPQSELDRIDVYTDGSCTNNQGNVGQKQRAGAGVFFGINDERNMAEPLPPYGPRNFVSNNRAELYAVIRLLQEFNEKQKLRIFTDSKYVLDGIRGNSKPRKNQDMWCILLQLTKNRDIVWDKVKGHSNIFGNICADALAVYGGKLGSEYEVENIPNEMVPWEHCLNALAHIWNRRLENYYY